MICEDLTSHQEVVSEDVVGPGAWRGGVRSWASVGVCAGAGFTVSVVGSTGYTGDVAGIRGWAEPAFCLY